MKKTLINLTDELRAVLDAIAASTGESIGTVVERLLRESQLVIDTAEEHRIQFVERTTRGNKSRVAKPIQK